MPIVGNGDIASVLPERDGFNFFAAGVSNSGETNPAEFQREIDLMMEQDVDSHLVYFSSLAILGVANSPYFEHKRNMEYIVKQFPHHTIVRIGNIDWGDNPHTLINYLRAHPEAEIRDEYRYIVDKDEFNYWVDQIPEWNCEISIPGRRLKVKEVYEEYVRTYQE